MEYLQLYQGCRGNSAAAFGLFRLRHIHVGLRSFFRDPARSRKRVDMRVLKSMFTTILILSIIYIDKCNLCLSINCRNVFKSISNRQL